MTTPEGHTTRRTFAPRDWSLRVKLAVVLLVPGLLAAVLGGLRIAGQIGVVDGADRVSRFVAAQGSVATLMERLQSERVAAAAFAGARPGGDAAALRQASAATDAAAEGSGPAVAAVYRDDATLADTDGRMRQSLAGLPDLRRLVLAPAPSTAGTTPAGTTATRTTGLTATAATARYTDLVDDVLQFHDSLLREVDGTSVTGLADALTGLAAARDETSLQLALVTGAHAGPGPARAAAAADAAALLGPLTGSDARLTADLQRFRAALDPGRRTSLGALVGPHEATRASAVQRLLAASGTAQPPTLDTADLDTAATTDRAFLDDIDAASTAARSDLTGAVTAQRSDAMSQVIVNVALLVLAIALGALVVGLVAREMLRSLRTLRSSALEVAHERLPEAVARMREGGVPDVGVTPVPVSSQEEIGEVARAFDAVHQQAVRLAAEQATLQATVNSMFVNLSRRSQTLVDRQLQLIEELETGEQDADQLANLFRLDHLATRMRRNSENLLVLAGNDLAKRAPHRVPLVDVLRAAVSETEQYERITLEAPPDVGVAGRAANDLQHLIAELLDNATSFSSPGTAVVLSTTSDSAGALVVEIVDHGVGMPAAELAAANALLGQHSATSVTASRRIGLFVVARLAARHGIAVRLIGGAPPTGGGEPGLIARVTVPRTMVMTGPGRARTTGGTGGPGRAAAAALGRSAHGRERGAPGLAPPGWASGRDDAGRARPGRYAEADGTGREAAGRSGTDPSDDPASPTRTGGDRARGGSTGGDSTGGESTGGDSTGADRTGGDRAGGDRAGSEVTPHGAAGDATGHRTGGDRTAGDADGHHARPGGGISDEPAGDRWLVERRGQARPAGDDRAGAAPPPADRPGSEREPGRRDPHRHDPGRRHAVRRDPVGTDPTDPPGLPGRSAPSPAPVPVGSLPPGPDGLSPGAAAAPAGVEESGWFRSYRQVPVIWSADPETGEKPPAVDPRTEAATFSTPADAGWRAAAGLAAPVARVDEAGLPRRVPGARLVPGTPEAVAFGSAPVVRDADAVRARLRDYQQGIRQGRDGGPG